jgi:putative membrane protein
MKPSAVILLAMLASPASAQSLGEETGMDALLGLAPSGPDVLLGIHQFNLFQQAVTDSASMRGDGLVKAFAETQSEAAGERDDALEALTRKVGLDIDFPLQPDMTAGGQLAGLQGSVGQVYVREFYQDEIGEHQSAISLLKRYLTKPDNNEIKAFAAALLPSLQAGLKQAEERPK